MTAGRDHSRRPAFIRRSAGLPQDRLVVAVWRGSIWRMAIVGMLALAAGGAGAGAAGVATEMPIDAARAKALRHMIVQDCGSCHGLTMRGGLGPAITPQALAGRDAEGLASIILDGLPGTAMPPWRPLITEPEARWIANWLLTKESAP